MPTPRVGPWWLLPNLLALDAPTVAVVWQRFLAAESAVVVPFAASLSLFGAVWALYLLDRVLDGRRGAIQADRHRFAVSHRRICTALMLLGLGGVMLLKRRRA